MTLKAVVDKSGYDALEEGMKALYKETDDGYALDLDGLPSHPDAQGLKKNSDAILEEKRQVKQKLEEQIETLKKEIGAHDEKHRKELEEAGKWQQLYESEREARRKDNETSASKLERITTLMDTQRLDNEAKELANQLGGSDFASALLPHIKPRLKVVEIGGERELKVLDAAQNISSLSPDDLMNELRQRNDLKPLIVGPGSSGGGSQPGNGSGGAPVGDWDKYFDQSSKEWNMTKQGELFKQDREKYEQLKKKYG